MEENKYKEALERAKSAIKECGGNVGRIKMIESIFPELAGDMDEQSRKWILEYLYDGLRKADEQFEGQFKAAIAYLEKLKDIDKRLEVQYKRGYEDGYVEGMASAKQELEKQGAIKDGNSIDPHFRKPITYTETKYPKFKVGDWVVDNCGYVWKIEGILNQLYTLGNAEGGERPTSMEWVDKTFHLWSIADAQDGDILSNGKMIVIFKHLEEPSYRQHIVAYIGLDNSGHIQVTDGHWELGIDKAKPATKEQCELLFRKMEEDGYFWNSVTKELSQISVTKKNDKDSKLSEEDEDVIYALETILDILIDPEAGIGLDEVQGVKNETMKSWLKSLKDRVQPQPKSTWSEEDEDFFGMLEGYLEFDYDLSMNDKANTLDWLKSVKYRIQPQPKQDSRWKWEEDDEKFFKENILIGLGNIDSVSPELYSKIIDWINLIKKRLS